jgi:hypothetical protein
MWRDEDGTEWWVAAPRGLVGEASRELDELFRRRCDAHAGIVLAR